MDFTSATVRQIVIWLENQEELEDCLLAGLLADARQGVRNAARQFQKRQARAAAEKARVNALHTYERGQRTAGFSYIAGVDEAGRGPLAGPVVAAAVILPPDIYIPCINDSKKLSPVQRDDLYDRICAAAVSYGVGIADNKLIDRIKILQATFQAMADAVDQLKPKPQILLNDAVNNPRIRNIPQVPIIKGDALSISIAAASIIAKVTRDRLMDQYELVYPQYGFGKHKGYFTQEHQQALRKFGPCPIHRRSFAPVAEAEEDSYAG